MSGRDPVRRRTGLERIVAALTNLYVGGRWNLPPTYSRNAVIDKDRATLPGEAERPARPRAGAGV